MAGAKSALAGLVPTSPASPAPAAGRGRRTRGLFYHESVDDGALTKVNCDVYDQEANAKEYQFARRTMLLAKVSNLNGSALFYSSVGTRGDASLDALRQRLIPSLFLL